MNRFSSESTSRPERSSGSLTSTNTKKKNQTTSPPRPRRMGVTSKSTATEATTATAGIVVRRYGTVKSTREKGPAPKRMKATRPRRQAERRENEKVDEVGGELAAEIGGLRERRRREDRADVPLAVPPHRARHEVEAAERQEDAGEDRDREADVLGAVERGLHPAVRQAPRTATWPSRADPGSRRTPRRRRRGSRSASPASADACGPPRRPGRGAGSRGAHGRGRRFEVRQQVRVFERRLDRSARPEESRRCHSPRSARARRRRGGSGSRRGRGAAPRRGPPTRPRP